MWKRALFASSILLAVVVVAAACKVENHEIHHTHRVVKRDAPEEPRLIHSKFHNGDLHHVHDTHRVVKRDAAEEPRLIIRSDDDAVMMDHEVHHTHRVVKRYAAAEELNLRLIVREDDEDDAIEPEDEPEKNEGPSANGIAVGEPNGNTAPQDRAVPDLEMLELHRKRSLNVIVERGLEEPHMPKHPQPPNNGISVGKPDGPQDRDIEIQELEKRELTKRRDQPVVKARNRGGSKKPSNGIAVGEPHGQNPHAGIAVGEPHGQNPNGIAVGEPHGQNPAPANGIAVGEPNGEDPVNGIAVGEPYGQNPAPANGIAVGEPNGEDPANGIAVGEPYGQNPAPANGIAVGEPNGQDPPVDRREIEIPQIAKREIEIPHLIAERGIEAPQIAKKSSSEMGKIEPSLANVLRGEGEPRKRSDLRVIVA